MSSYRYSNAPALFFGAFQRPRIFIGYITSTLSNSPSLTHASMSSHTPGGSSVCIHSVAVVPTFRRWGIALGLLNEYIARLRRRKEEDGTQKIQRVLLITHDELKNLYAKAGFQWVGKSSVAHGARDWFEMRLNLGFPIESNPAESVSSTVVEAAALSLPPNVSQQAVLEALAASSSQKSGDLPPVRTVASLGGLPNLVIELDNGEKANKHKLICLREGCGSVILLPKTAQFKEMPSIEVWTASFIRNHTQANFPTYDPA